MSEQIIWVVRAFVYHVFVLDARPPEAAEIAAHLGISERHAEDVLRELHDRHALFLEAGASSVRMANPFSAIVTPFRVRVGTRSYYANCAWDALGIPAALGADAAVDAGCAASGEQLHLRVTDGIVSGDRAVIHFPLPFRRWYDDLIYT